MSPGNPSLGGGWGTLMGVQGPLRTRNHARLSRNSTPVSPIGLLLFAPCFHELLLFRHRVTTGEASIPSISSCHNGSLTGPHASGVRSSSHETVENRCLSRHYLHPLEALSLQPTFKGLVFARPGLPRPSRHLAIWGFRAVSPLFR